MALRAVFAARGMRQYTVSYSGTRGKDEEYVKKYLAIVDCGPVQAHLQGAGDRQGRMSWPHYSSFSRDQGAGRATQRAAVLIRASARRRPSSRRVTRISPEAGKTPVSAVILT